MQTLRYSVLCNDEYSQHSNYTLYVHIYRVGTLLNELGEFYTNSAVTNKLVTTGLPRSRLSFLPPFVHFFR